FSAPAPASAVGEAGPRQALDPFTGEVIADETETEGLTIVGVFDDVLVTATGEAPGSDPDSESSPPSDTTSDPSSADTSAVPQAELVGRVAEAGGEELWRIP